MNRPERAILYRRSSSGGPTLYQRRSLQEANLVSLSLSGNQLDPSQDPRGQRVRQIRKTLKLDPSAVATEACISLGQLYELETGGERLFYSTTLRDQAGRRVAAILGLDWDTLALTSMPADTGPDSPVAAPASSQRPESGTAQTQSGDSGPVRPFAAVLRRLVWVLALVMSALAAVRLGGWSGLQLPL